MVNVNEYKIHVEVNTYECIDNNVNNYYFYISKKNLTQFDFDWY